MNAIIALREMGYRIEADGEAIRLNYVGAGTPAPERVTPLVAELKAHKGEALVFLAAEWEGGQATPPDNCATLQPPTSGPLPVFRRADAEETAWWSAVAAGLGLTLEQFDSQVGVLGSAGEPKPEATVIEPGTWVDGEPPEAPPTPADGPSAAYWGWPPLPQYAPAAGECYQPGECRPTLFCGPVFYPPVPSQEQALARLERFLGAVKAHREQVEDADGDDLDKLDYLRGPLGQHDRETIWRGGLGKLPGTGPGGLPTGWPPLGASHA